MEVAVKPTRPPPPIATKPKPSKNSVHCSNSSTDTSRTPSTNGNAPPPTKPPAPAVKPKPKQSPPQVHRKPFCKSDSVDSRSTAREQTTLGPSKPTESSSPKVSPAASKKLQHPALNNDLKAEIAQQLSQKNKRDNGNDTAAITAKLSPVQSSKLLSRKTANQKPSPVLPKKLPPPRPPGGVATSHHKQPVIPVPQVINQQQATINKPTDDGIYETPDQTMIPNGTGPISTVNNSNATSVTGPMDRSKGSNVSVCSEYETPASVRDSIVEGGGDINGDINGDIYARLSDTFETPPESNVTKVGGGERDEGGDVYEVPVSVGGDDSVVDNDAYETPDIESIRMIQRQLMEQSSNSTLTGEKGGVIPPPPAMMAPKPHLPPIHAHQQKNSPLAKRKLPSFPPPNGKGHAPSKEHPPKGDGYTKVKGGMQFTGQVMTQDGLIYEEVKPKQQEVVEQEEYIDPALVMPTDPLAPPLPPRKQFQSGSKSDIRPAPLIPVVKTPSPLETKGEGLELMDEDEEGEDYVDMSAVTPPITPPNINNEVFKHRAVSDTRLLQHQSLSYSMGESDGIYEQMDISRPVPPPRNKRRNKTTRNPPPHRPNLKSSLSFDSGAGGNYITMHRQN